MTFRRQERSVINFLTEKEKENVISSNAINRSPT